MYTALFTIGSTLISLNLSDLFKIIIHSGHSMSTRTRRQSSSASTNLPQVDLIRTPRTNKTNKWWFIITTFELTLNLEYDNAAYVMLKV